MLSVDISHCQVARASSFADVRTAEDDARTAEDEFQPVAHQSTSAPMSPREVRAASAKPAAKPSYAASNLPPKAPGSVSFPAAAAAAATDPVVPTVAAPAPALVLPTANINTALGKDEYLSMLGGHLERMEQYRLASAEKDKVIARLESDLQAQRAQTSSFGMFRRLNRIEIIISSS